jgi:alanyl-tRNA synthetase
MDLTKEILEEKGYQIDEEGLQRKWKSSGPERETRRETTNYMGADATVYDQIDPAVTTEFDGYDKLALESEILVLTDGRRADWTA